MTILEIIFLAYVATIALAYFIIYLVVLSTTHAGFFGKVLLFFLGLIITPFVLIYMPVDWLYHLAKGDRIVVRETFTIPKKENYDVVLRTLGFTYYENRINRDNIAYTGYRDEYGRIIISIDGDSLRINYDKAKADKTIIKIIKEKL